MKVSCYVKSCKYRDENGWCGKDWITVSDEEMTAAGFYPICQDYEETYADFTSCTGSCDMWEEK